MKFRDLAFVVCLAVFLASFFMVIYSPVFNRWENRHVSEYYLQEGFEETESANVVASIVWDFRGFDTLGEETVLFTAAVGVFTVIVFGIKKKV